MSAARRSDDVGVRPWRPGLASGTRPLQSLSMTARTGCTSLVSPQSSRIENRVTSEPRLAAPGCRAVRAFLLRAFLAVAAARERP